MILHPELLKPSRDFGQSVTGPSLLNSKVNRWTYKYKYMHLVQTDGEEVEIFYKMVKKAMKQLKSQDITNVMGDFNSKVGSE